MENSNLPSSSKSSSLLPRLMKKTSSSADILETKVSNSHDAAQISCSDISETEMFSIGDRVLTEVGGHEGNIVFLGETKFAPGIWAGIILDKAVGKNDGSVDGVSYFKCDNMHGLFLRTFRLKKVLKIPDNTRCLTPTSSVGSTFSSVKKKMPLKIGERVLIGSVVSGTKSGTLRYIGLTDFGPGEWAGVELDSACGKNNGTVGNRSYFECSPKFGIFTPLHKVIRSPRNVMEKPLRNTPNKSIQRQRSDMSDVSLCSSNMASIASGSSRLKTPSTVVKTNKSISSITAPERLRTCLRAKESQLEMLISERELNRSAVAKAASQTDMAEMKLELLKQEFTQYKVEQEKLKIEHLNEKRQFEIQLDDERHKNEDLVFRLEEEAIIRADDGSTEKDLRQVAEASVQSLNLLLDETKHQLDCQRIEFESKIQENQEKLLNLMNDNSAVKMKLVSESQNVQDFSTLERSYTEKIIVLEKTLSEKSLQIVELKSKLETSLEIQSQLEVKLEENSKLQMRLNQETVLENATSKDMISCLVKEKKALEELVKNGEEESFKIQSKFMSQIEILNSVIEKHKEDLDSCQQQISEYHKELELTRSDLSSCNEKYAVQLSQHKTTISNFEAEIIRLENLLKCRENEIEKLHADSKHHIIQAEQNIVEEQKKALNLIENVRGLEDKVKRLTLSKEKLEESFRETTMQFKQNVEKQDLDIQKMRESQDSSESVNQLNLVKIQELKEVCDKKSAMLSEKESQINILSVEKENINANLKISEISLAEKQANFEDLVRQLEISEIAVCDLKGKLEDLQKQLDASLKEKDNFMTKLNEQRSLSCDSDQQISTIMEKLKQAEIQLSSGKKDLLNCHHELANANKRYESMCNEFQAEVSTLRDSVKSAEMLYHDEKNRQEEDNSRRIAECEELKCELSTLQSTHSEKLAELSVALISLERLKGELLDEKSRKVDLQIDMEALNRSHNDETIDLVNELKNCEDELETVRCELVSMTEALDELRRSSAEEKELHKLQMDTLGTQTDELKKQNILLEKSRVENEEIVSLKHNEEWLRKTELLKDANDKIVNEMIEEHKQEIELLILKLEKSSSEISRLNEVLARSKADHDSSLTSLRLGHKREALSLQDEISLLKRKNEDLTAQFNNAESKVSELSLNIDANALLSTSKLKSIIAECDELRTAKLDLEASVVLIKSELSQKQLHFEELKANLNEQEAVIKESRCFQLSSEKHKVELSEKLQRVIQEKQKIEESQAEIIDFERRRIKELQLVLRDVERERDALLQNSEELSRLRIQVIDLEHKNSELADVLDDATRKHNFTEEEFAFQREELNAAIHKGKILLKEKTDEIHAQKIYTEKLKHEKVALDEYRQVDDPGQQIDFLNSVIVDMQRKIDELNFKLSLYDETNGSAVIFNGFSSRQIPPRLFCDICEQFDMHDTEDCPVQAAEITLIAEHTHHSQQGPVTRAYCDVCEVFGHSSLDCDATETF